jgi:hypothetical protein
MMLRPKRKEKGFKGAGLRVIKEAQSRPFLSSPPIGFGGTGRTWAHTRNVAYSSAAFCPAAPTDSSSPAHQHLSYWTLMTLELVLVARFLEKAHAEAGTSGTILHAL